MYHARSSQYEYHRAEAFKGTMHTTRVATGDDKQGYNKEITLANKNTL